MMLASIVFTTTKLMRRSVPESVEPGLKPNQPKARMNVAENDHRHIVSRHGLRLAPRIVLADARPDDHRARESDDAAHRVHDARAGEVDRAVAEAPVDAALRQPAATPDPVRVEAVGQARPTARTGRSSSTPSARPSRRSGSSPWCP